jgi:hypothetical protein
LLTKAMRSGDASSRRLSTSADCQSLLGSTNSSG